MIYQSFVREEAGKGVHELSAHVAHGVALGETQRELEGRATPAPAEHEHGAERDARLRQRHDQIVEGLEGHRHLVALGTRELGLELAVEVVDYD